MRFELSYKGRRLQLKLHGDAQPRDIRLLLDGIARSEEQVSESELRTKVVRQLKSEIMQDNGFDDVSNPGWWEVPQELLKHKEAGSFITMESDLNASLLYEKASFTVKTMLTESGKQFLFDREQLLQSLKKLSLHERLSQTNAVLVRVKGAAVHDIRDEVEDFLRKFLQVERLKVVFEKKNYGDRASVELVLFGDFLVE
jgi:hypothetical protein